MHLEVLYALYNPFGLWAASAMLYAAVLALPAT